MNAVEFTNIALAAEAIESTVAEEPEAARRPAPSAWSHTRVRYALLLGIALLSAWLAISIGNSIREIEGQLDMIQANLLAMPK